MIHGLSDNLLADMRWGAAKTNGTYVWEGVVCGSNWHNRRRIYSIQANSVALVEDTGRTDPASEDTPEEYVEFEGDFLDRREFKILFEGEECVQCGRGFEFKTGHVAIPFNGGVICSDCTKLNDAYVK